MGHVLEEADGRCDRNEAEDENDREEESRQTEPKRSGHGSRLARYTEGAGVRSDATL